MIPPVGAGRGLEGASGRQGQEEGASSGGERPVGGESCSWQGASAGARGGASGHQGSRGKGFCDRGCDGVTMASVARSEAWQWRG